jgi:hypothetical protein
VLFLAWHDQHRPTVALEHDEGPPHDPGPLAIADPVVVVADLVEVVGTHPAGSPRDLADLTRDSVREVVELVSAQAGALEARVRGEAVGRWPRHAAPRSRAIVRS